MINYILDVLKDLTSIDSPSGYTKNIMKYIEDLSHSFGYKCEYTRRGALMIHVEGEDDYTIGLSGHADTLGLMVRSIKSDGTLAFTNVGGPLLPSLDGEYCKIITRDNKVYTGTILSNSPAIHVYNDAPNASRDYEHMHVRIDEVIKCKEDVLKLGISNGDYIAYDPKTIITESGFIKSRFLDDKMSVAILIGFLKYLSSSSITPKHNLCIIFSNFEEVGSGCAYIPEYLDEFIAVDMGCIGLDLSCSEYDVSICAKDSSGPYDYEITSKFIELAKKHNISYAVDIYPMYGSDVSAAIRGGNNTKGGLIGPGIAASHGMERTHIKAVENTFELLKAYIL